MTFHKSLLDMYSSSHSDLTSLPSSMNKLVQQYQLATTTNSLCPPALAMGMMLPARTCMEHHALTPFSDCDIQAALARQRDGKTFATRRPTAVAAGPPREAPSSIMIQLLEQAGRRASHTYNIEEQIQAANMARTEGSLLSSLLTAGALSTTIQPLSYLERKSQEEGKMKTGLIHEKDTTTGTFSPKEECKQELQQVEKLLTHLGSSIKERNEKYVDVLRLSTTPTTRVIAAALAEDENSSSPSTTSKQQQSPCHYDAKEAFPKKLHRLLCETKANAQTDIISFHSHGRAFAIHDLERFQSEIMPKYFKHSKLPSFRRQLSLYCFKRIIVGPDAGSYYHDLFLEIRPDLCSYMRRVGVPHSSIDRRKRASEQNPTEGMINFYSMTSAGA